jgi:predicted Zn-dependent protease
MNPHPPDTRPAITEEQLQRLIAAIQRSGGAHVEVSDPRVSQVQTWILGLVGVGVIAAGGWVAQSISTLSQTVSTAVTRLDQQDETQRDHEQRLRDLERSK